MFKPKSQLNKSMNKRFLGIILLGIFAVSILTTSFASGAILSASTKNSASTTLFALNNTSGSTKMLYVTNAGKLFALNGGDFHNGTVILDSSKLVIRNPASTFGYTIAGGAVGSNQTLTLPVVTTTSTLAVLPTVNTVSITSDFHTTSASPVDVTGLTLTLPNTGRPYSAQFVATVKQTTPTAQMGILFNDNGAGDSSFVTNYEVAGDTEQIAGIKSGTCSGQVVKLQAFTNAGNMTIGGSSGSGVSRMIIDCY